MVWRACRRLVSRSFRSCLVITQLLVVIVLVKVILLRKPAVQVQRSDEPKVIENSTVNTSTTMNSLLNVSISLPGLADENGTCLKPSDKDLNHLYNMSVSPITLSALEDSIFGTARPAAESHIEKIKDYLKSMTTTGINGSLNGFRLANESGIEIGGYTYRAGGHWEPRNCTPRWKVAIVIPFRDREEHLPIALQNLITILQLQRLAFGIYVPEQSNRLIFNKGLLMNIAFLEALKFDDYDCFVFHDVDQMPMKGALNYGCENLPRHLCARPSEMDFKPMYTKIFGGAISVTPDQMRNANGFSNAYWGWGGEDDDIRRRLDFRGYNVSRAMEHGYFMALKHQKKSVKEFSPKLNCLTDSFNDRMDVDGINRTVYSNNLTRLSLLYTHFPLDIRKEPWNEFAAKCHQKKHKL